MIRKLLIFDFSDDSFPLQDKSGIGAMEYKSVKEKLFAVTKDKRSKYNKFKDEDHYTIGKYTAIHGTAATFRKFMKLFPHYRLTESTVRAMREKYHRIVKSLSSSSPTKKLTSLKISRPLLFGSLDEKVQKFIVAFCSKGVVVNATVVVTVAKPLIKKSLGESLKGLDLDNSSGVKSFFVRIVLVKRACTTGQPEIPKSAGRKLNYYSIMKLPV